MRLPRVPFMGRQIMVVVAVVAVMFGGFPTWEEGKRKRHQAEN
jgi:hypothetical protein